MALSYDAVLETLFYPFESGALPWPADGQKTLFMNAHSVPALQHFDAASLILQQYFKPYADALQAQGYDVQPGLPDGAAEFDCAFLLAPKNQVETLHLMARALGLLKPDGVLVVAAGNKAGGGRLVKAFTSFGLTDLMQDTRNKARVVWARKTDVDAAVLDEVLAAGAPQKMLEGAYQSWPGIYGWNKIDQGSTLLAQHLPDDLRGAGADFGCGYGYLGRSVLENCQATSLICLDADWRAVEMARCNLTGINTDVALEFLWRDCTRMPLKGLDFIVMNPPFHEGKAKDIGIGEAFIANAAASLKPGGRLWMVANRQLPYEHTLAQHFKTLENLCEAQGFKVFCAQR